LAQFIKILAQFIGLLGHLPILFDLWGRSSRISPLRPVAAAGLA